MLKVVIPAEEWWDDDKEQFVQLDEVVLELEHSLLTLSKWEEEFEKPFLSDEQKTPEEALGYIKAMIQTPDYPEEALYRLTDEQGATINQYLEKKMTATTVREAQSTARSQIITNELIYSWMFALAIPKECEKWHLNKLFMQIRVINAQNQPKKNMTKSDALAERRRLNAERRALSGSTG